MKRSGTSTVFIVVCTVVLVASYGIGLCIREIRFRHAVVESTNTKIQNTTVADKAQTNPTEQEQMPSPRTRDRTRSNFSDEERPGFGEGRPNMREDFENMSEEDRAQMRERMGRGRRGGGDRTANLSDEERAQLEEERRSRREQFENMSEEERAQMRERMGRGRRGSGNRSGTEPQDNN